MSNLNIFPNSRTGFDAPLTHISSSQAVLVIYFFSLLCKLITVKYNYSKFDFFFLIVSLIEGRLLKVIIIIVLFL